MTQEANNDWATPPLKEEFFWRDGMTPEEYEEERQYLINNFQLLKDGEYRPLWAQREGIEDWIKHKQSKQLHNL